ncbi:D-alanine--D-alanine ligase [Photobacterium chitinilyticum]|uniref:D-alanine--D-alanine ligase n=1 Tax=Photobacterium chitinilyticum TaxID=2485123 RepID=UPI0013E8AC63|nr:D-alanine--D-alanine ligase [Photobacterium chitinilyticum]
MVKKVAVLYGGSSSERNVSLMSGKAVSQALKRKGYDVIDIDVDHSFDITSLPSLKIEKAFLALHGGDGEDGTLQAALQLLKIPYTGSDHRASAVGIDKAMTKKVWQASGITTPRFFELNLSSYNPDSLLEHIQDYSFPLVVKPATQGCSIGINKAHNIEELHSFIEEAFIYEDKILIEQYISGREFTVGILDQQVLPTVEITHSHSFFSHEAKFKAADTQYHCPAELSADQEEIIRALALSAFRAINASGWGRVDIIADENGYFYAIEVNTAPGMTTRSVFPLATEQLGIDFDDTVEAILRCA